MLHNEDLMNGHPLRVLRTQLDLSQKDFAAQVGVSEATISRAESGHRLSPKVRRQLCDRLGKTSHELGLMGRTREVVSPSTASSNTHQRGYSSAENLAVKPSEKRNAPHLVTPLERTPNTPLSPSDSFLQYPSQGILSVSQSEHMPLLTSPHLPIEQQESAWLTLGASYLGQLLSEGWSSEEILASLQVVLQGVQGMPTAMRRQLLKLGADAMISGISVPTGKRISEEELLLLHSSLGESINAGFNLFHSSSNAQVLAVGQALLHIVQKNHALLFPRVRSIYYSGVYNLIGLALLFQAQYQNALDMHMNAHIAALSTGDPWNVAQSLMCQAGVYQTLEQHDKALQAIEEALLSLSSQTDTMSLRAKAHLLGCWADSAMTIGDFKTAQQKLEGSIKYLDLNNSNEEFDYSTWLQLAGKYALFTGDYSTAIQHLEEALNRFPSHWLLRRTITLLPLASAYARKRECEASLTVAQNIVPVLMVINAPKTTGLFNMYVQRDLLGLFSHEPKVRMFLQKISYRPLLLEK